jgi:hypothetical protein
VDVASFTPGFAGGAFAVDAMADVKGPRAVSCWVEIFSSNSGVNPHDRTVVARDFTHGSQWHTLETNGIVQQIRAGKIVERCHGNNGAQGGSGNVKFNAATVTAVYINSPHVTIQTTTLNTGTHTT